jgi:hypothetical protein
MFTSAAMQKVKWAKAQGGWQSRCGRFRISRWAGPSPAWQMTDKATGTALVDVRVWMLKHRAGQRV